MKPPRAKVSVVIPTYNSWVTLQEALISLGKQTLKPIEVIVVNNGSTDKTPEILPKKFPWVKLINLDKNTGVTGGRNTGIKALEKHVNMVLFFDHDMVADKRMLENLVALLNSNDQYGITTPKICYLKQPHLIWAAGTNINLWTGQVLFRGGEDLGQYDRVETVQVAPAAMLVKKAVVNKLKNFDERYFATYEDTDFCFRAKKMGWSTVYTPYALAYHDILPDRAFTASRLLSRSYFISRNRIIFMKDYSKSFPLFLMISPVFLLYFLYLSIKYKNLKGLIDYIHGVMVGLRGCFFN